MAKNRRVRARVAEIMERAAVRAEIGMAVASGNLVRLAGEAEDGGAAPGLRAARAASTAAARLNGLADVRDGHG